MISDDLRRISGFTANWLSSYDEDSIAGPDSLHIPEIADFGAITSEINKLNDSLAIADESKIIRKANIAVFSSKGRLPFGSRIGFSHTHRYAENNIRFTSDILIPGQTFITSSLSLAKLEINGSFVEMQFLDQDYKLSPWAPCTTIEFATLPLLVILKNKAGHCLEIGCGSDVWRWNNGLNIDEMSQKYKLSFESGTVIYERIICDVEDETVVTARSYRFTWFLAWSYNLPAKEVGETLDCPLSKNGEVDTKKLRDDLTEHMTICLDLHKITVDEKSLKTDQSMCFAKRKNMSRLKSMIRKIISNSAATNPLIIKNLNPGICTNGSHLDRKTEHLHWDYPQILDFAAWTRHQCPEREIYCEPISIPSQTAIFQQTNHEQNEIDYEYNEDGL
ncbi:MAG: hypothetical protein HRT89_10670 [Lentisphaeria bacterium]|nr:hypothetical protein [Lentisphaeria bacterium]NQZ68519.1 hypothetical protein [Lentisphaeria bacterium]